MGGGGTVVNEFPYYYAYGMYPGSERWVPAYGRSFSSRRRSGLDYFYDNVGYEDDPLNYYYVDVPVGSGASFARRRKRNRSMEELLKPGGQDAPDILGEKAEFSHPDFLNSNEVGVKGNAPPSEPSTSKKLSQPRVVSVPVQSSEGGEDKEISTMVPAAGIERSRTGTLAERAAVLIQSEFRGYLVRRTQPLAHLRNIATVRSELARLNEKLLDPDFIAYARENPTGRLKLTETIMRLLLELDAIQGAHPVVRDIRKATSKQVIALQDGVDDLISGRMETMVEHQSANNLENDRPAMQEDVMSELAAREEPAGNNSYQSSSCEASEDLSLSGTSSQVMTPVEHDDNEKEADHSNLNKFNGIPVEAFATEDQSADNEAAVIPVVQYKSEPFEEETQKHEGFAPECDLSRKNSSDGQGIREQERLNEDGEIPQVGSAKVEAILTDEDSRKQEPADNIFSLAPVMAMDEKMGSLDINSEVSDLHENADTVQMEGGIENPLASEIERRSSQAAPAVPKEYTNEDDEDWWIDDGCDENATSKVEDDRQDDIAELYSDKSTPTKTLLEKASMPSTSPPNCFIPGDQAILTMPCVQDLVLPYKDHTQRGHESQLAEYLGMSPARDFNYGNILPTSRNDLDKLVGNGDDRALLFKLGKENEVLKSLLMGVIKWNQIQATTIQDVNRRLSQLESRRNRKSAKVNRKKRRSIRMQ